MEGNNPDTGTADTGPLSIEQATEHLTGILTDSEAAPVTPESEIEDDLIEEEVEAPADDTDIEESDDEGDPVELEFDDDDTETDEVQEPTDDYIEIDGERVTLDEVGNGYLRQSDYTKKTQAHADEVRKYTAERDQEIASITQEREHLKQMLDLVQTHNKPAVDMAQLSREDPLEYIRVKAEMDADNAEMSVVNAEKQRLANIEAQNNQDNMVRYVAGQQKVMAERIPEISGKNAVQYKAELLTYMEGIGFSKDELSQLYDSRAVVLADKARKYDALMGKGTKSTVAKKVKGKPKVVRPGVQRSTKGQTSANKQKVLNRARQSGSASDAVNALLAL